MEGYLSTGDRTRQYDLLAGCFCILISALGVYSAMMLAVGKTKPGDDCVKSTGC